MKNVKCKICESIFACKNNSQKYCSSACSEKHRKEKRKLLNTMLPDLDLVCKFCNKTYKRKIAKSSFCTKSCGSKYNIRNGIFDAWRLRANEKLGKYVKCSVDECEEKVYVTQKLLGNKDHRHYCSKKCGMLGISVFMKSDKNTHRGTKATEESKEKQKAIMMKKYGVTNAFALSKRRTTSRPQIALYEKLVSLHQKCKFEIEKFVKCNVTGYYADIICESKKTIIEYHGDYWHCNPKKYRHDFFHQKKKCLASEIWERDKNRQKHLEKLGYKVIVVWGSDFSDNPDKVLANINRTFECK